ncbi:glycosyltransferase family 4 protein [Microbacterium profundi]
MHIIQIAPVIGPGSGVAGVVWNLEREFIARGHTVERFTAVDARRRPRRRQSRFMPIRALTLLGDAVGFSTIGAVRAKRFTSERPGAVTICHNGPLFGDIYVNHGVIGAAMQARGNAAIRMLRNPTHVFTHLRDLYRYRGTTHRAVVALTRRDAATLAEIYGRVRPPVHVIPHGVELSTYRPPTAAERTDVRAEFQLTDEHRVALFVGHEFERKGADIAIRALTEAKTVMLLLVGGNQKTIADAQALADTLGVAGRVRFAGRRSDIVPLLWACDMLVLPSAYESFGLVITEALATGVPVVSTPVGCAPDLIVDGRNGYVVRRNPQAFAEAMERIAALPQGAWRDAAAETVETCGWDRTADRYLELLRSLAGAEAA